MIDFSDVIIVVPSANRRKSSKFLDLMKEISSTIDVMLLVPDEQKDLYADVGVDLTIWKGPMIISTERNWVLSEMRNNPMYSKYKYLFFIDDNCQLVSLIDGHLVEASDATSTIEYLSMIKQEMMDTSADFLGLHQRVFSKPWFEDEKKAFIVDNRQKFTPLYKAYFINLETLRNDDRIRLNDYPELFREDISLQYLFWYYGYTLVTSNKVAQQSYTLATSDKQKETTKYEKYLKGYYNFLKQLNEKGIPCHVEILSRANYNRAKKKFDEGNPHLVGTMYGATFNMNKQVIPDTIKDFDTFLANFMYDFMGGSVGYEEADGHLVYLKDKPRSLDTVSKFFK